MELINIKEVKENPNNPRSIQKHKFTKLVNSIKEFPEMLKLRPIVVDDNNVVLGGNMRLKASIEAGLTEVWSEKASDLTPEQQKEFIIKDNSSFGDWDWDVLANEWDTEKLNDWGIDLPILNEKLQVEKYAQPEIEITEEILEEHNYIVFTFDNQLDWQVAREMFDIKTVAKPGYTDTYMQKGVGRVKKGRELIDLFNKK